MNDIDEIIADLNAWPGECDCTIGSKAAAALQNMQTENKRLDAALKEISLGVVAPMDFAKKAREGGDFN